MNKEEYLKILMEGDEMDDINNISHIVKNIYLSGIMPLSKPYPILHETLQKNKIKVIISMTEKPVISLKEYCKKHTDMKYYHFSCEDLPGCSLTKYFKKTYIIINKAISEDKNVLVHCMQGVSRSTTIVIAFLMRFMKDKVPKNKRYDVIYTKIQNKRKITCPNRGFRKQLYQFNLTL